MNLSFRARPDFDLISTRVREIKHLLEIEFSRMHAMYGSGSAASLALPEVVVRLEDEAGGGSLDDSPRSQGPDGAFSVAVFDPQVLGHAPGSERSGRREHEAKYPPLDAGEPQADRDVL